MESADNLQAAADRLYDLWREGAQIDALDPTLRPADRAEGYAIQACLEARSLKPLYGWKIAATSGAGQAHLQVEGPLAGRLLAEQVRQPGATLSLVGNHMALAEPEFAFRMARDLPPRPQAYQMDEVVEAVETLHTAIELPSTRFFDCTSVGALQLIADNACAHEFVLGPAYDGPWRSMDLASHRVIGSVSGKLRDEGCGANVLGDPRLALTWLANELSSLGVILRAGRVVTTGTCLTPLPLEPGDEVVADFGEIGKIGLHFCD